MILLRKLFIRLCMSLLLAMATTSLTLGADLQIPDLGDPSGGLISPAQEYDLGQKWLRIYRAQVPTTRDPFLQVYVENLIRNIAAFSELKDRRLDILVIENATLNAFAVPGGIIGVHTGLFRYSETEEQLASVMAHEVAHLSQRHYARRIQQQKNATLPTLAAMLAGILIIATTGSDAGLAAISMAQAGALQAQLRFSRQMEQEADRIGMETLVRTGMSPHAMPEMFQQMLKAHRFQRRPPEFLMSHPVTESRISDSQLRAQNYKKRISPVNIEFQLVKARAELLHQQAGNVAVKKFQDELLGNRFTSEAAQYGLVLALIQARQFDDAAKELQPLREGSPKNVFYLVAEAQIATGKEDFDTAIKLLTNKLKTLPNHHALNVRLAEVLMKAGQYKTCKELLQKHVKRRPKDDYLWYLLAEVNGLAGHILDVHLTRAEYFKLNGLFDKAEIQLNNALRMSVKDEHMKAKITQELRQVRRLREDSRI